MSDQRGDRTSPRHLLYRLWNGVYPDALCQLVIDEFDREELYEASIQTMDGDHLVAPETRAARHTFIEPGHWCGALISHYAYEANKLWRLDLTGLGTLSLIRYDPGGHFNWHVDVLAYDKSDYEDLGDDLERKLSVIVNLSDPEAYEGGELEFLNSLGQLLTQPELRERGSVVVFPSTVGHRVVPISAGVRYALVGWMVGPPLR